MATTMSARRTPRFVAALAVLMTCAAAGVISIWAANGHYPLDLHVYMLGGHTSLTGSSLYGSAVHIRQYGFTYPPFAAWLFALPSTLPVGGAFAVMTSVSVLSVGVIVHLSDRTLVARVLQRRSLPALCVVLAMLSLEPVRTNLRDGQINLVLGALIMIDLECAGTRRWRGALTGVAAAVKLTPALFIVYFCIRRRYADAARAAGVFLAAGALAAMLNPRDSVTYWTSQLLKGAGIGDIASDRNHSVNGLLKHTIPQHSTLLWIVLATALALVGLKLAVNVADAGREAFGIGIVGITACLISPVSWSHHWVWFIPCCAGIAGWTAHQRLPSRWPIALVLAYVAVIGVFPPGAMSANPSVRMINTYAYLAIAAATFAFAFVGTRKINRAVVAVPGAVGLRSFCDDSGPASEIESDRNESDNTCDRTG